MSKAEGGQGIALKKGSQNVAAGFADAGVIHGDDQQGVITQAGGVFQNGLEEIL